MGKNLERYLMIPVPFLAFMIFSLACLSNDNFEGSGKTCLIAIDVSTSAIMSKIHNISKI